MDYKEKIIGVKTNVIIYCNTGRIEEIQSIESWCCYRGVVLSWWYNNLDLRFNTIKIECQYVDAVLDSPLFREIKGIDIEEWKKHFKLEGLVE